MSHAIRATGLIMLSALLLAGSAVAGTTDAEKCEADKLKRAGKYAFCRMKAESKAVKKGEPPDYSKCDTKLSDKFGKAELKWGMECPTTGDAGAIQNAGDGRYGRPGGGVVGWDAAAGFTLWQQGARRGRGVRLRRAGWRDMRLTDGKC